MFLPEQKDGTFIRKGCEIHPTKGDLQLFNSNSPKSVFGVEWIKIAIRDESFLVQESSRDQFLEGIGDLEVDERLVCLALPCFY